MIQVVSCGVVQENPAENPPSIRICINGRVKSRNLFDDVLAVDAVVGIAKEST